MQNTTSTLTASIAALAFDSIREIFNFVTYELGVKLEQSRKRLILIDENTGETLAVGETAIDQIMACISDADREDVRLAYEREAAADEPEDERFSLSGAAAIEDYAPESF